MNSQRENRLKRTKKEMKKITDMLGLEEIEIYVNSMGEIEAKINQLLRVDLEVLKSYYQVSNMESHKRVIEKIQEVEQLKSLFYGYKNFQYTISCYVPEIRGRLLQEMSVSRQEQEGGEINSKILKILSSSGYEEEAAKIQVIGIFDKTQADKEIEKIIEEIEMGLSGYENLVEEHLAWKIAEIIDGI